MRPLEPDGVGFLRRCHPVAAGVLNVRAWQVVVDGIGGLDIGDRVAGAGDEVRGAVRAVLGDEVGEVVMTVLGAAREDGCLLYTSRCV